MQAMTCKDALMPRSAGMRESGDLDRTPACAAGFDVDLEYPYMDSSSFASTLFDDLRYDCSRIFGL